jgi:hypothetical protein
MENNIKYSNYIDDGWHTACFYETNDKLAIIYTAKLRGYDNRCFKWALHQFSGASQYKQLRSGWFYLPGRPIERSFTVSTIQQPQVIIDYYGYSYNYDKNNRQCVIHSVVSSGQSDTPQNKFHIIDGRLPIPLLKANLEYSCHDFFVYCSEYLSNDDSIHFPGLFGYNHIIGNLYSIKIIDDEIKTYLVDIDKKKILCSLSKPSSELEENRYSLIEEIAMMALDESYRMVMKEYGAL